MLNELKLEATYDFNWGFLLMTLFILLVVKQLLKNVFLTSRYFLDMTFIPRHDKN